MSEIIIEILRTQLRAALWECCSPSYANYLESTPLMGQVITALIEDARAFASKDPASGRDPLLIIKTYTSFKAVLHYRLANAMHYLMPTRAMQIEEGALYAPLTSSRGKMLSGAELHFKCQIGARFVLDHGVGTVLGETSVVGDDCYILGGVTLGASGISDNILGKRHPTLGNRVQIGAFSSILGLIVIGDDVFVGPHCTINENIASKSRVTSYTRLQIVKSKENLSP